MTPEQHPDGQAQHGGGTPKRRIWAFAVLALVAPGIFGVWAGRSAGEADGAPDFSAPRVTNETGAEVDEIASVGLPEGLDVPSTSQRESTPDRHARGAGNAGVPAPEAGALLENPGGAPDLTPDGNVERSDGQSAPVAWSAPADPERSDSDALLAARTITDEAAMAVIEPATESGIDEVPNRSPEPDRPEAFVDPCARASEAEGCGVGYQAEVLGSQVRLTGSQAINVSSAPGQVPLGSVQVLRGTPHAAECSRQIPDLDFSQSTVFAVVMTVPTAATVEVTFHTARTSGEGPASPRVVVATESSAPLGRTWQQAWTRGTALPKAPLCVAFPNATIDALRDGCTPDVLFRADALLCRSKVGLRAFDRNGIIGDGTFEYTFDAELARNPWTMSTDGERRAVRIEPIDDRMVDVHVPMTSDNLSMVAVAGYPAGFDCRLGDPTRPSTVLPVTRQPARTRYFTPNPAIPTEREAVVTVALPSALASGEIVDLCVYWYTLPTRSFDLIRVDGIERHSVVAPSRAATEIRFLRTGANGGPFSLPHAGPRVDHSLVTSYRFSFLADPALDQQCGFNGTPRVLLLDDPALLCRFTDGSFAERPRSEVLYAMRRPSNPPDGEVVVVADGRRSVSIDNRGCSAASCGPTRVERINLSDGTFVELSFGRVPLATEPMLLGGRVLPGARSDGWTVDPEGFQLQAPDILVDDSPTPRLDATGVRVTPVDDGDDRGLRLELRADRPINATATFRPRSADAEADCRPVTVVGSTSPAIRSDVLVANRLCPSTSYSVEVTLTETSTVDVSTSGPDSATFRHDDGVHRTLAGRTNAAPMPPDFDYEWSMAVRDTNGRVIERGAVVEARVRINTYALADVPSLDPSRCRRLDESIPIASGRRGADSILGDSILAVQLTTVDAGASGLPAGWCWIGGVFHRFAVSRPIRWDGRTVRTFELDAADGSTVVVTLRPAAD